MSCRNRHAATCKLLVEHGAAVDREVHTWTPLKLAAENGDVKVAEALLDGGANVDRATTYRRPSGDLAR